MPYSVRLGVGWDCHAASVSGQNLNNANNWNAAGIRGFGVALNNYRAYVSSKTGTVNASDITAELYSANTSDGKPNASIEGPVNCDTAITGAGFYQWSGFTTVLTAGVHYYVVLKNANGTPASNYIAVQIVREGVFPSNMGSSSNTSQNRYTTTDGGTTWTNAFYGVAGPRFDFAGGIYRGLPISDTGSSGINYRVYSSREAGSKFTSPANARMRATGLWIQVNSISGTPTGSPRIGLYVGSDAAVYTDNIPNAAFATGVILFSRLSTAKEIPPSTVCRIVLSETTQSDTSANGFNTQSFTVENTATSKGLLPFGAFPLTYWDGSSWTDVDTLSVPCGLMLDDTQEFGTQSSGVFLGSSQILSGGRM